MLKFADVYSSCKNCVTAKLQKASSQPGSSLMAFSQFIAAFQGMPRLKQASARFLQKQCFLLYFRHFSRTTMDYEYLPSLFKAAALLLCRWRVTQNYQALSQIFSRMASHTSRHSLARQLSRQRQDRYSAADKLLGEYFSAALRSSMALSLSDFKASQNKSKEFFSFFSRTITSLFSSSLTDEYFLGIKVYVSSFSSSFTSGKGASSCLIVSTTFRAIPKPVVFCLSILRLFLKIGDCISSKQWLLVELVDIGTLKTLLVTVSFSCSALLMTGGAGMRLLMSSATLMPPFWKRVSKMF